MRFFIIISPLAWNRNVWHYWSSDKFFTTDPSVECAFPSMICQLIRLQISLCKGLPIVRSRNLKSGFSVLLTGPKIWRRDCTIYVFLHQAWWITASFERLSWYKSYPLRIPYYQPRIREILKRWSNARYLSKFDANHGYYSRRLARKIRPLIFLTTLRQNNSTSDYRWVHRLPLTYTKLVWIASYDDCRSWCVPGRPSSVFYYRRRSSSTLRILFERLQIYGVPLNGNRCHILRKENDYPVFTMSVNVMRFQEKKI